MCETHVRFCRIGPDCDQFRRCMAVNRIMQFVLHLRVKLMRDRGVLVVVNTALRIGVGNLLIEASF